MATHNINKIVRGNINLKPWVLSKNTTDIVNSYVQKLYKQIPDNFKNDLFKTPTANRQPANQAALRTIKPPPYRLAVPIVTRPKSKLPSNGYRSPPITTKNSFVSAPKKLLKTPNFKIYSTRKYASSVSSSSASIFRNDYEERRRKIYKPANGMQFRTFTGAAAMPGVNSYNNPGIAKYIAPTRLYNEMRNHVRLLEVTNVICKDLMSVDEMLKKKLRVVKSKPLVVEPVELDKQKGPETPLKRWNHPSTIHLNKLTASPLVKKPSTSLFGLSIKQKLNRGKVSTLVDSSPRTENARHQARNSIPYTGAISKLYNLKTDPKFENDPVAPKKENYRDPIDFVCRSRTVRTSQTSNSNSHTFRKF